MKKILFVNPGEYSKKQFFDFVSFVDFPPSSLTMLAAHTPPEFELEIVDEHKQKLDFDVEVDLVAITAMTIQAPRAYKISNKFRDRGIPVVLGGIHASFLPEEATRYSDSVVVGEAEDVWREVLNDFDGNRLKKIYHATAYPDIDHLPIPRHDLLAGRYSFHTVQTTRGCPNNCDFCSVTHFNGLKHRMRSIDNVIDEIEAVPTRRIVFIDDNIVGTGPKCIKRSRALFERLKEHNKVWFAQSGINIAEDGALLRLAREAGARVFLIGLESLQEDVLKSINKKVNLRARTKNYIEVIRRIQASGIAVIGGLILGTDGDDPASAGRLADFVYESGIDGVQFTISTPLPGTRLFERLHKEGRILYDEYPDDWERFNVLDCVYDPLDTTREKLLEQQLLAYQRTCTLASSLLRGAKSLLNTRSLFAAYGSFSWSYGGYKYALDQSREIARH